ncbi:MAG: hypothetical protein Kow0097_03610 [Candidatus Bipolaricaulota bacterium]
MNQDRPIIGIAPGRVFPGTWWDMVELCQRLGFAGVEFKHELPFILPDRWGPEMVHRIAQLGREEELVFSLHGPYTNIGALLPNRWKEAVDEHLRALECAEELGASTYTVHPGWVEKKYATPDLVARCRDNTTRALERMSTQADSLTICVENQNPAEADKAKCGFTVEQLRKIVDGLNPVGFTLDVGHAQLLDGRPDQFLQTLGPTRIRVGHLHDNGGEADDHLPPGQGIVDWVMFLAAYRRHRCTFPLYLELAGGADGYASGRDLLQRTWDELATEGDS